MLKWNRKIFYIHDKALILRHLDRIMEESNGEAHAKHEWK